MTNYIMAYKIEIVQGDITQTNVEVIVNAANNEFWMGSGVAGAIKKAGGDIIEKDAMTKGPVMPGEAVYSVAGTLPYKLLFHAAVMGQDLKTNARLIRLSTLSCLKLAEKLEIDSIAFPAFGTGVGGFPMKACAFNMVSTVHGYRNLSRDVKRVQFCLFDSFGKTIFEDELEREEKR